MEQTLVITEKPSVAQSIAKVLGAYKRYDGYLSGNGWLVSWCVGHLVELAEPEDYDSNYKKWAKKADATTARFNALSDSIKAAEKRLAEIAALKKHIFNYSRTKETFAAYKKSGYSRKFLEEHREEITIHRAAKAAFDQLENTDTVTGANGKQRARIPTIKELNREYAEVLSGKKKAYSEYRAARREMQDLLVARKTIDKRF